MLCYVFVYITHRMTNFSLRWSFIRRSRYLCLCRVSVSATSSFVSGSLCRHGASRVAFFITRHSSPSLVRAKEKIIMSILCVGSRYCTQNGRQDIEKIPPTRMSCYSNDIASPKETMNFIKALLRFSAVMDIQDIICFLHYLYDYLCSKVK